MARYEQRKRGVYDNEAGRLLLPRAEGWADYQAWLAQGNRPDDAPWMPPAADAPAELAARAKLAVAADHRRTLRADSTIDFLRTHTPAEVDQWVATNVTDLASAKQVLRKLAMIAAYLARERLQVPE